MERRNFDDAGKAFMGVALLYDDPAITPRALAKGGWRLSKSGKDDEAGRPRSNCTKSIRISWAGNAARAPCES